MDRSLRRFWIPPAWVAGTGVSISGDVLHHLRDVCRLAVGSRFEALTGDGKALLVELRTVGSRAALGEVVGERTLPELPRPHLRLALAVPRFPVLDAILEKAVELGVSAVTTFVSEFSFLKRSDTLPQPRRSRWEKIVRSATQQCGRGDLMAVSPPVELAELLDRFGTAPRCAGVFAFEGAGGTSLHAVLPRLRAQAPEEVWIFVGSEGGFSAREVEAFRARGLEPVTLGPSVLRVETACVALVSIVSHELHVESPA